MNRVIEAPTPGLSSRSSRFVRRGGVVSAWLLAALLSSCGGSGSSGGGTFDPNPAPTPPQPSVTEITYAREVMALVNTERTSRGLNPVSEDLAASEAAYGHAYDMEVRGFFDHVNPSGEDPGDRLRRAGVSFFGWGENIARGQSTPADVMTAWMASTGHRRNILDPSYGRLGVGVRLSPGGPWWVQDFVAP